MIFCFVNLMFTLLYQNIININHNIINIGLFLYKNINIKLIYIKSTIELKNYNTIRSILKKTITFLILIKLIF